LILTLKASKKLVEDGHATESKGMLYLSKIGLPTNIVTIFLQIVIGVLLLVLGAKGFIHGISALSQLLGVSALLISLLIIPIATELPEKINSILWVRRGKDTLAFGNITGAMVFQGTLLPAIGILLTPWVPRIEVLAGIVITLIAVVWLRIFAAKGGVPIWGVLLNGVLYVCFIAIALSH
jgi:cation:H+ antiporter